jgi:LysR family transcriptional regulator, cell division regulator
MDRGERTETMDSGALRIFKAVADEGGVSRAAAALNTVQSNVTARLKRLEEELGTRLFARRGRGMELTPAGRLLDGYAGRILRLMEEAERAVTESAGRPAALALGTMETTAAVRLPPVLSLYQRRFPHVEMTLVAGPTEHLVQEVLAWRLDCAFVAGPVDHPDLAGRPAFEEELVLTSAPQAGPAARRVLLAFRRGCSYRAKAESWAREQGCVPLRVQEFGSLDAILGCVAAGMGVALLPRSVVCRPPWSGTLAVEDLPERLARVSTWFVRRADAPETEAMAALLDCVGLPPSLQGADAPPAPHFPLPQDGTI